MKKSLMSLGKKMIFTQILIVFVFGCPLLGVQKIKYGDFVRIQNFSSEKYISVEGNKVWASAAADDRSIFIVEPDQQSSAKIGDSVQYGDIVLFRTRKNVYLGRFGDWRIIFAMNSQMFGVGPKESASRFKIISPAKGVLDDNHVISLAPNESEFLRFNPWGNEIFLAPDFWTMGLSDKKVSKGILIVKGTVSSVTSK